MKLLTNLVVNLRDKEVIDAMKKATRLGLKDTIVEIADDAIEHSPVLTGNNRRSITYEVGPGKEMATEDLTAATFSTSGYGGYLEVGTASGGSSRSGGSVVSMGARPYFRPALDKYGKNLGPNIKRHMP